MNYISNHCIALSNRIITITSFLYFNIRKMDEAVEVKVPKMKFTIVSTKMINVKH